MKYLFVPLFIILLPLSLRSQVKMIYMKQDSIQTPVKVDRDSWFGVDKVKHLLGSLLITRYGSWILYQRCNMDYKSGRMWASGFSISLGITKELLDLKTRGGHFCWKDLAADCLGVLLGIVLISWQ